MTPTNNVDRAARLQKSTRRVATPRQRLVIGHLVENGGTWSSAIRAAGYSEAIARNPQKLMQSKNFMELLEEAMPDVDLAEIHKGLLASKKVEHMVFPLGPKGEDDPNFSGSQPDENPIEKAGLHVERTTLTDKDITDLLAEVGGTVRRIVHGETARHVYFWASNDKTRHDALKLAYDLKGKLSMGKEPPAAGNTYNTFIQENHFDPNSSQALVRNTLQSLMNGTKRKVLDVDA